MRIPYTLVGHKPVSNIGNISATFIYKILRTAVQINGKQSKHFCSRICHHYRKIEYAVIFIYADAFTMCIRQLTDFTIYFLY